MHSCCLQTVKVDALARREKLAADLQRTFLGRIRTKHERRYRLLYKTAKRRLQSEIEQIQLSGVLPDDGWMDEEDIRELVARVDPGFAQVGDAKAMRRAPSSPDVESCRRCRRNAAWLRSKRTIL